MPFKGLKRWILYPENPVRLALILSLPLVGVLALLFFSVIHWEKKSIDDIQIRNMTLYARAFYQHIITSPIWRGPHGGYFIETTEHLNQQNKISLSIMGRRFTRVEPSLFTPQIDSLSRKRAAYRFHITSLESVNTSNRPDRWELESLGRFKWNQSQQEVTTTVIQNIKYFRFMKPLKLNNICLNCHRNINAGISIDIPVDYSDRMYAAQLKRSSITFATFGLIIILFVMAITWFFSKRISDGFRAIKKLNEQLQEISAKNKKLLDSIIDGIAVINSSGIIEVANPSLLNIINKSSDDIIDKSPEQLGDEKIKELFTSEKKEIIFNDRVYTITDVAVHDEASLRDYGRLRIIHDATEEKTSAIVELAGAAAHELRQPLTIILNLLSIIKDKAGEDKDLSEELKAFESQCHRINDIINKMLKITRYKKKKYTKDIDIIDIHNA